MSAQALGPHCNGCRKRVAQYNIPRCPKCRTVLCLKCKCPNRCFTKESART